MSFKFSYFEIRILNVSLGAERYFFGQFSSSQLLQETKPYADHLYKSFIEVAPWLPLRSSDFIRPSLRDGPNNCL